MRYYLFIGAVILLIFFNPRPDPYSGKVIGKVYREAYIGDGVNSTPEAYLIYMDNGWIYETDYLTYGILNSGDSINITNGRITILKFKHR